MAGEYGEVPIHEFEGERVDVSFFRIGPQREKTIRERYTTQAFLQMNHVGERWVIASGRVKLLASKVTGLWKGVWSGDDPNQRLSDLSWEEREHVRGALLAFQRELLDLDCRDAMQLVGRHEGHHLHRHVTHFTCSCDDNVSLSIFTGAGSMAEASCPVCGKQGVVAVERTGEAE